MDTQKLNDLTLKTMEFFKGDAKRIQHFIKVNAFSRIICEKEHIDEKTTFITLATAIVHDVGIRVGERKYGHSNGKIQEQEGPAVARELLRELSFSDDVIDRVAFIVGHHHTYSDIQGEDYRILVEADFLVNFLEDEIALEGIKNAVNKIFVHQSAIKMAQEMFLS